MKKLSRRVFLRLSGSTTAGVLLATTGCSAAEPAAPAATATKVAPTATVKVTATTAAPTATPTQEPQKSYYRPEIIQFHPTVKSKVVQASNPGVWNAEKLDPKIVRQMVDQAITQLTGNKDVKKAWQALFKPTEQIAIKVNAFRNSTIWTHPELVKAVTDSLQEAGIPGEQILVFDYFTTELTDAGYTINKDGPGVRCYGTDSAYATEWKVGNMPVKMSDILVKADALINMPVLKSHMIAGMTFALKNHFGSVSYPDSLHNVATSLTALNALAPIKDATRLIIGDVLEANTKYENSFPYWSADAKGDSILMSFDPLAHDRVGLDILTKMAEEKGNATEGILGMCDLWLKDAGNAGIGTNDLNNIELVKA